MLKKFFLLLMLFVLPVSIVAQERFEIKGRVIIKGRDRNKKLFESEVDEVGISVYYFWNKIEAQNFKKKFAETLSKSNGAPIHFEDEYSVTTTEKGHFTIPDGGDGFILMVAYGEKILEETVTKKNYRNVEFDFYDEQATELQQADIDAKRKKKAGINTGKTRAYGRNLTFNIGFQVPEEQLPANSRIFVSPVVVDCQTGDTVDYLQNFISDASEYHHLQNQIMAEDFEKNDPVNSNGSIYVDQADLKRDTGYVYVQYTVPYEKPNQNHNYACAGEIAIEDYTHDFYRERGIFGTCNEARPFRFFNWGLNGGVMPLSEEFHKKASSTVRNEAVNLALKFITGKSELTPDSINDILFEKLRKQLERHGKNLVSISVMGGASPEGSLATNQRLAKERANLALSIARKYIAPGTQTSIDYKTYEWKNVADSLIARGDSAIANTIKDIIATHRDPWGIVKNDSIVGVILNNMRVMEFTYSYQETKPLEPEEAVAKYDEESKKPYEERYVFTLGDYFNILKLNEKKPKIFRKVIEEIYEHQLKGRPQMECVMEPFYSFVINRIANYSLEEETPDTTLLKNFLDDTEGTTVNALRAFGMQGTKFILNRPENVATQASMALKLQCLGIAQFWAELLPDGEGLGNNIKKFTNLVEAVLRWDDPSLDPEIKEKGIEAAEELMASDSINSAVLKTELMEEFEIKREDAIAACEKLNDNEPRKWYLLAIHQALKAGTPEDFIEGVFEDYGTGFQLMSQSELDKLSPAELIQYDEQHEKYKVAKDKYEKENGENLLDVFPNFLAYLQKAFDLTKGRYKKHYASEALVPKGIYDKYPYNPRMQKYYRRKFEMIYAAKQAQKKKLAEKVSSQKVEQEQKDKQEQQ